MFWKFWFGGEVYALRGYSPHYNCSVPGVVRINKYRILKILESETILIKRLGWSESYTYSYISGVGSHVDQIWEFQVEGGQKKIFWKLYSWINNCRMAGNILSWRGKDVPGGQETRSTDQWGSLPSDFGGKVCPVSGPGVLPFPLVIKNEIKYTGEICGPLTLYIPQHGCPHAHF